MSVERPLAAVILALLLLWGGQAAADDLAYIYRLAYESDPELQSIRHENRALRETVRQAYSGLLPALSMAAEYGLEGQDVLDSDNPLFPIGKRDFTSWSLSLTVNQPLFRYSSIVEVRQAKTEIRRSELRFQTAVQDLILRVATLYFEALAARNELDLARAEQAAVEAHYERVRVQQGKGLASVADLYESRARLAAVSARAIEAESSLDDAREALHEVCGERIGPLAPLADELPLVGLSPPDVETWIEAARARNLRLGVQQQAVEVARQEVSRQKAGLYPVLNLVAEGNREKTGGTLFGEGNDVESKNLLLRLNVPIYQGGLVRARVREAMHRLRSVLQEEERQSRAVVRQTRAAYFGVTSAISRTRALQQSVASQELALDAREEGYASGLYSTPEVLDAVRDLFLARRDYARARYDYLLNGLRLKQAVGSLSEEDVLVLDQWLEG